MSHPEVNCPELFFPELFHPELPSPEFSHQKFSIQIYVVYNLFVYNCFFYTSFVQNLLVYNCLLKTSKLSLFLCLLPCKYLSCSSSKIFFYCFLKFIKRKESLILFNTENQACEFFVVRPGSKRVRNLFQVWLAYRQPIWISTDHDDFWAS